MDSPQKEDDSNESNDLSTNDNVGSKPDAIRYNTISNHQLKSIRIGKELDSEVNQFAP